MNHQKHICETIDYVFDYWKDIYPLLYVVPTTILNILLFRAIMSRKKLNHIFYSLFCILSFSFLLSWYSRWTRSKFFLTLPGCYFAFNVLNPCDRIILFIIYPRVFFFYSGQLSCIIISVNRFSMVCSPLKAILFWYRRRRSMYFLIFIASFIFSSPIFWSYSIVILKTSANSTTYKIDMPNTFPVNIEIYRSFMGVISAVIIISLTLLTMTIVFKRKNIFKQVQEKKILVIGFVFSIITSIACLVPAICTLELVSGTIQIIVCKDVQDYLLDFLYMLPAWTLIISDNTVRRTVLRTEIRKTSQLKDIACTKRIRIAQIN